MFQECIQEQIMVFTLNNGTDRFNFLSANNDDESLHNAPVIRIHALPTYGDSSGIAGLWCRTSAF